MGRIGVGIIGAGWIAGQHVRTLRSLEGVELAGVCDLEPARVQALTAGTSARGYDDWRLMLEAEELSALFVCLPPLAHREPAVTALERRIPVYLEKPIARSTQDAAAIVRAADETTTVCAIGYQWHAIDLLDDLLLLLEGQDVGLIVGTSIGPTASRPWFLDRKAGGGNLLERGSHHIDLCRLVGGEVAAVQAAGSRVRLARSGDAEGDIDDAVTLVLSLQGGGIATIVVAWTKPDQPGTYSLQVAASESTLRLDLDPEFALSGQSKGETVSLRSASDPAVRSVERFLAAVRQKDPSLVVCTPDDALRTLAVAVAGEQALESGRAVEVAQP